MIWLKRLAAVLCVCIASGASAETVPADHDQYMLELIHRARANPTAEAARLGIDLNEGLPAGTITTAPKQPLAFHPALIDAARSHTQWMLDTNTIGHTGAGGSQPWDRIQDAGYDWWAVAENIAGQWWPLPFDTTEWTGDLHDGLVVDGGVPGRGHRTNVFDPTYKEFGSGVAAGMYFSDNALFITEDFGTRFGLSAILTGVVYDDSVEPDDFYTPGEGLNTVEITAVRQSDQAQFSTITYPSGGYSLPLPAGTYTVTASGGGLPAPDTIAGVIVNADNVKLDFLVQAGVAGDVNGDDCVNVADLLTVRNALGQTGSGIQPPGTDVNGDSIVNVADLLIVRNNLGAGACL